LAAETKSPQKEAGLRKNTFKKTWMEKKE
jgi:hypothetical protein